MPYDPGISYHGDKYLYDAISGLGQDAAKAMAERKKMAETGAYNDTIMQLAHQEGRVSDDEWNKYQAASLTQKSGIATGHAASMAADLQRQVQQSEIGQRTAQTALINAQLAQTGPFARDPMEGQPLYHPTTGEPIGTYGPNRQVQYYPAQATESANEPVITDPLKIEGKTIPGIGTNRKTGQYVYYGDSGIIRDDKTGALGTRDIRGNFKPLSSQQITAMDMDPSNPLRQTTTPKEKTSWLDWAKQTFGSGDTSNRSNAGGATIGPAMPPPTVAAPNVGEVRKGYKFLGGDPSVPGNWQQVQ